jgi:rhamnose utilization protein RhaD (predicted bifunctional aldolase and dehydrogenase)
MNSSIKELVDISRKFGSDSSFVLAGGGNTSYKDDDHIWIKASGVSLATIDENGFVCLSREKLKVISQRSYSSDSLTRENEVKADLANAIVSPENLRPSVETSLHDIIGYRFIIHTHPTKVNGMMCSLKAEEWCTKLFGDNALFVPYTDPGYILFKKVEAEILSFRKRNGFDPKIIFLENHGVFVGADAVNEIDLIYADIIGKINSAIKTELPADDVIDYPSFLVDNVDELHPGFSKFFALGKTGKLITSFLKNDAAFAKADTSFTPDDIVYCKAHYLFLPKMGNDAAQVAEAQLRILDYEHQYGYLPKVLAIEGEGIIAVEDSMKSVINVLEVYQNILKISYYAENFGGPKFMTKEQIEFIDNWEVENYRRKMAKG